MTLENFFKLRAEKQDHIINAAFRIFGRQGYRKASIGDIAQEGGTTKGMITHYFGSKKTLYLYLVELIQTRLLQIAKERITSDVTDFFEKLRIVMDIQMAAIKEHPALISFVNSLYYEADPEVAEHLEQSIASDYAKLNQFLLEGTDFTKFKPGNDPRLICKFVLWANDGFMTELYDASCPDKEDALIADFYYCLDVMKKSFYLEDLPHAEIV